MLEVASKRLPPDIELVEGDADHFLFDGGSFDGLTFTYLLRYVDDPAATLAELARVVRPGGTVVGLEFAVPENPLARTVWKAYVGWGLPLAGRLISPSWAEVGGFLSDSITASGASGRSNHCSRPGALPASKDVGYRRLSFGGHRHLGSTHDAGLVVCATDRRLARLRNAAPCPVHALALELRRHRRGDRADLAPGRLGWTLAAFALALGIGAHALDELRGRPLATRIPDVVLWGLAAVSIGLAIGIGVAAAIAWWPWLAAFVAFGGFIVVAYNLELFGGAFHSDLWFAIAWGSFPLLTAFAAVAETVTPRGCRCGRIRGAPQSRPAASFHPGADGAASRAKGLRHARPRRR